jgi:excisionase family DNA binding protein
MPYSLTTKEVADRLGTTKPTVRSLIEAETLLARKETRGSSFQWRIDKASVNSFLAAHGRYDERVRITGPTLKTIDARLSALEDEVHQLSSPQLSTTVGDQSTTSRQIDDARARIVDLEEALARSHFSAELQHEADDSRTEVIEHLLAAVAAAEHADGLRRRGYAELDEALQGFTLPGHAGELTDS